MDQSSRDPADLPAGPSIGPASKASVEAVFREAYGRAVATLVRAFGDIDLAEEAVQDAFAVALARWPVDGVPPSPAGWIVTTPADAPSIASVTRRSATRGTPRRLEPLPTRAT